MAEKKPEPFKTRLVRNGSGFIAQRNRFVIRFLMDDGNTVDVETDRDDSDLRGALVQETGQAIQGSVVIARAAYDPWIAAQEILAESDRREASGEQ